MTGYINIDCKGLNLLAQDAQTIDGLYAVCLEALATNKPINAVNCVYGEGVPMTPVSVMAINEDGTIIFTASILQIRVSADDSVTIVNLLTPAETKTTRKGKSE